MFKRRAEIVIPVLLVNSDERSVIKSPLPLGDIDTRALLTYEAGVVDLLNQRLTGITDTLPVAVPLLIHHSRGRPSWTAFSWVPGEVLSLQEVQQRFSPDDFRALGEAVGEFAVRLARALDLGSFKRDIERPYGICAVDHELWLAAAVNSKVDRLHKQGYTNLATVLGQLGREYQDLRRAGQLRPTIIGHNDLHLGNYTFVETSRWRNAPGGFHRLCLCEAKHSGTRISLPGTTSSRNAAGGQDHTAGVDGRKGFNRSRTVLGMRAVRYDVYNSH